MAVLDIGDVAMWRLSPADIGADRQLGSGFTRNAQRGSLVARLPHAISTKRQKDEMNVAMVPVQPPRPTHRLYIIS